MKITKVELLWSRKCPFRCSGCAMPRDDIKHEGTLEQWMKGIKRMHELGSQFVAIYGAEPLVRKKYLIDVINKIYEVGMRTTVITALPYSPFLKEIFDKTPLDSLSVSWDGLYRDQDRKTKSTTGWQVLLDNPQIRDRAVIATVMKSNADNIIEMAKEANKNDFWFLCDLFHTSIGPLSKCGNEGSEEPPTKEQVQRLARGLIELKKNGGKIHSSIPYYQTLVDDYDGNPRNLWHCRNHKTGWLTVDANGDIMPCDDWQKRFPNYKIWDDFSPAKLEKWNIESIEDCPGCAWNTHWDAVAIEEGIIELGTYIHLKNKEK